MGLTFGEALDALKQGKKVHRSGWIRKGMWLEMSVYGSRQMYKDRPLHEHILIATQDMYIPWVASQTCILSEDWEVLD